VNDSPEKRLSIDREELSKGCLGVWALFIILELLTGSKEIDLGGKESEAKWFLSLVKNLA
jgi:hypothetical protein